MTNRVLWMPAGPRSKSSSRIQVYNIHDKLLSMGYDSQLVFEPRRTIWQLPLNADLIKGLELSREDLIIIQKFKTNSTKRIIKQLRKYPVRIAYLDCDEPIASEIAKLTDFVIVPSTFLQKRYEQHGLKCYCIEDSPERFVKEVRPKAKDEILKCVWFGNHSTSKWQEVTFFQKLLQKYGIRDWHFETISNTSKATHYWNNDSFERLTEYDLVVIPVPEMSLEYKIKSSNRLLQSMALGLPVLASPVPSYLEILERYSLHSEVICNDEDDWVNQLQRYTDAEFRLESAFRNIEVAKAFALDTMIYKWIEVLGLSTSSSRVLNIRIQSLINRKAQSLWRAIKPLFFE